MRIFAISDIHGDIAHLKHVDDYIKKSDAVLICGDISRDSRSQSADEILSSIEKLNKKIFAVHGNWDGPEVLDLLVERGYSVHGTGKITGDFGIFGAGGSIPTPIHTPSEYLDDELYEYLEDGYNKIKSAKVKIMLSHTPPLRMRDRTFMGLKAGSPRIRDFLEHHKVDLSIVGHIHEAHGIDHTDYGIVANPGAFKKGRYLLIEAGDKISAIEGKA